MEPTQFHEQEKPSYKPSGNRIEFDPERHKRLIEDRGIEVQWEKSFLCPCRNPRTNAPDPSCHICNGRGIGYLPAKFIYVAIQNQESDRNNMDLGLYDSGTAIGTTEPSSQVTFRDRITLPEVEIEHSLLFNVTKKRIRNGMFLNYDVDKITYAVTDDGKPLFEDEDYTFDKVNNRLYPREHLYEKNVSLNITSTLRYIVTDLLKESRLQYTQKGTPLERTSHLPKKLLLKREDAWVNPTPFVLEDGKTEGEEAHEDPKRNMNTGGGFFGGAF